MQSFEFIRSAKGHQLKIQKHEILQEIWKIACDLGFAASNCSWIFAPGGRSWQLLAAPGSSCPWQPLAATKLIFCMIFGPGGRKIVITRRSWQLQSSYFACTDLWTCWIRFWYSRNPKLTKMICFWQFSFLYFFIIFIFFQLLGRRHEALAFKFTSGDHSGTCVKHRSL